MVIAETTSQKFRLYVLDSDRATDVLAYLLCYGIEIKDKPRTCPLCISSCIQAYAAPRTTRSVPHDLLHRAEHLCRARLWAEALVAHQGPAAAEVEQPGYGRGLHDTRTVCLHVKMHYI